MHWAVYGVWDFLFSGVGSDGSLDLYREYVKHSLGWFDRANTAQYGVGNIIVLGLLGWFVMGIAVFFVIGVDEVSGILCCNDRGTLFIV